MLIYAVGHYLISPYMGYTLVAISGIMGLALKNNVFNKIESIYKKEKYKTLLAYSQKN